MGRNQKRKKGRELNMILFPPKMRIWYKEQSLGDNDPGTQNWKTSQKLSGLTFSPVLSFMKCFWF